VELPGKGRDLKAGDACAVVESVKTASDVYAPVSGKVVEVNQSVVDDPALVNAEPFEGGWFCKIQMSQPAELNNLLSAADYGKLVNR
jgi:glycine cleavage system H protein